MLTYRAASSTLLGCVDLEDNGQLCKMEEPHRAYSARGASIIQGVYVKQDRRPRS